MERSVFIEFSLSLLEKSSSSAVEASNNFNSIQTERSGCTISIKAKALTFYNTSHLQAIWSYY
jgi:hypothetical protein